MGLSTNVLWHQTSFEGLKSIIQNRRLTCSYSLETIIWKGSELKRAFPMISFCDLPFSDMSEYLTNKDGSVTGKYGRYTIGMKRTWGKDNKLSPVWYRDKESLSLRCQKEIYDVFKDKKFEDYTSEERFLWHVTANTKNIEGKLKKHGFESYRFYDECEFRYIPSFEYLLANGIEPSLSEEDYETYKIEHDGRSLIEAVNIPFTIADISYILVSKANKISDVKNLFEEEDCSKILFISYEQIMNDFIGISHNREL